MGHYYKWQAINNLKANAAGRSGVNNIKAEAPTELPDSKPIDSREQKASTGTSTELPKRQSSSVLPPDFFDQSAKRLKTGKEIGMHEILIMHVGLNNIYDVQASLDISTYIILWTNIWLFINIIYMCMTTNMYIYVCTW